MYVLVAINEQTLLIWHCNRARFKYSCSSRKVYGGTDSLSLFISFSVCLCLSIALSFSDQQDCMNNAWTVNHFSTLYPSCHLLCLGDTSIFTHIHFFSPFGPFPHLSSAICPLLHSIQSHTHKPIQHEGPVGHDKWKPILELLHLVTQSLIFGPSLWVASYINDINRRNTHGCNNQ